MLLRLYISAEIQYDRLSFQASSWWLKLAMVLANYASWLVVRSLLVFFEFCLKDEKMVLGCARAQKHILVSFFFVEESYEKMMGLSLQEEEVEKKR